MCLATELIALFSIQLPIEQRSGRPRDIETDKIVTMIKNDRSLSLVEIGKELGISDETVRRRLLEAGWVCKLQKWVPHSLTEFNMHTRYDVFWVEPGSEVTTVSKKILTADKVLLIVFWDCRSVIHYEFLKSGQIIDSDVYCKIIERVDSKIKSIWPSHLLRKGFIFHQDNNARPHTSLKTRKKIFDLNWQTIHRIVQLIFIFFRILQSFLNGAINRKSHDVKQMVDDFISLRSPEWFKKGIYKSVGRWECMKLSGNYLKD